MKKGHLVWRVLFGVVVVFALLADVWPTPYQRARWAGMDSRVSRFSGEQSVRVPWTFGAGADEPKTRVFCAACHGQKQMDLTKPHEHELWLPVGAEPPAGKEPEALSVALAKLLPPHAQLSVSVGKAEEGSARRVSAEVKP